MTSLYTKGTIIYKLWKLFSKIFSRQTKPTRKHLFEIILSVLALNGYQSVKFNYEHFINDISGSHLNSYYYTLNESKIELSDWMEKMLETALSIIPEEAENQPIIISIDDTMVEKYGEQFEARRKLFDHAAHNGSYYLNGHCFVSLVVSVPVIDTSGCHYISFPITYRMWTKEQSKLDMASDLVRNVMRVLGDQRQVILCCDSWYPKASVVRLVDEFVNLALIANVRSDTAIYELPPESTGRRGRPRVRGNKIPLKDIDLSDIPDSDYLVGAKPVITELFNRRTVYAVVTKSKDRDSRRLFICTADPATLNFDPAFAGNSSSSVFSDIDTGFLPLTIYEFRWDIEVSYYEQKSFWALEDYMLRSKIGIERLLNLLTIVYSFMTLLPYISDDFYALKSMSRQQARFVLGDLVRQQVFLTGFESYVNQTNNPFDFSDFLVYRFSLLARVA